MTTSYPLGHADSEMTSWRSVYPIADQRGLAKGDLADPDAGASVEMPPLISAWTRRS
ncbi:hypothetical protein [Mycobacterium sp. DL592]|uniref:hypothetical protein n=1 Tax=Mycobacterium sp. DL592 TaxID=2675524 RepID=UPI001424453C|nr:hypothetical protein [Mycobacterium sp. DL592]